MSDHNEDLDPEFERAVTEASRNTILTYLALLALLAFVMLVGGR